MFGDFHVKVVVSSSKVAINLPRAYEKLHCEGEPYRFSVWLNPSVHTDRKTDKQTEILLLYYEDIKNILFSCARMEANGLVCA